MKTLYAFSALALALFLAPAAKADSIVFDSYNAAAHTYTYDLKLTEHHTTFDSEDGYFELTGLLGVTRAVLTSELAEDFYVWFDSTSVFVGPMEGRVTESSNRVPFYLGTLKITSLYTPGNVRYDLSDNHGQFSGEVEGPTGRPVNPVPEPSTLLMLGTGLLGAVGSLRRKFRS